MKSIIYAVAIVLLFLAQLQAQNCTTGRCTVVQQVPSFTEPVRTVVREVVVEPTQSVVQYFQEVQPVRSVGVAALKTSQQVAQGVMRHVGGSLGGARYEGVGFSTVSPEDAVRKCCYSNRPIREQSVQYGYNRSLRRYGWFATILCD